MSYYQHLQAKLIRLERDTVQKSVIIQSNGDELALLPSTRQHPIFCLVDSQGYVVRAISNWLECLVQQVGMSYSIKTVEQYGRTLSYLCRWLESNPPYPSLNVDENIKLLNRHDVLNWLNSMSDGGAASKNTLHSREACLRHFLDWLSTIDGGRIRDAENSPWGRDGSLKYAVTAPNAHSPKFISADSIVEVLRSLHNECERCMFHAQYDMGLRISELIDLKASDIPDDKRYDPSFEFIPICINGVKGRGGQKKERITLISRAVLRRIKRYHSSREYKLAPDWGINEPKKPAFLTVNQMKWGERNASKQFKNAVIRSGMPQPMPTHWLRHGTAFSVLRSDMGR